MRAGEGDPVTRNILIGQLRSLGLFPWLARVHRESTDGAPGTAGAGVGGDAVSKATGQARKQR